MPNQKIKRVYNKDLEFDSDLFKLEVTNMLKNIGAEDKKPLLTNVEHCHFYRTYDSNGKKQTKCSSIGGHHHEITVSVDSKGNLVAECSPAVGTKFNDNHTHKVTYLKSDRLQKRKPNIEAIKVADVLNQPPVELK